MDDEIFQRADWKIRILSAAANRDFDDEILVHLIEAGFNQAYAEGLRDAAFVCERVGNERPDAKRVTEVLAKAIRELSNAGA